MKNLLLVMGIPLYIGKPNKATFSTSCNLGFILDFSISKKIILYLFLFLTTTMVKAQSCEELIEFVKSESYGSTYSSPLSDAISEVTFYTVTIDFETYYCAIVCFKEKYSYGCNEYIYIVSSTTEMYYSLNYFDSAGKAFWKYIQPYHQNSECSPDL
ncbi:hypothetical protein [Marivirga sp.]|uniref:hypothetical protein n=1 Tax=Marivirga sp. TaxID=2018662 RepID=UPI0025E5D272|nr:hypothetical protein [Marivirga sp.]